MASAPSRPPLLPTSSTGRRNRPWLLPSNRKLRNLISISLRNLSPTPATAGRARGKTIDDDGVPNALKSPAKLVALREQKALGHSKSSTDLRKVDEHAVSSDAEDRANGSPLRKGKSLGNGTKTPARPLYGKLRRRSTLEWANASPQRRQEKLEGVTKERMGDVFYSLHVDEVQEPVYISEVVESTMNPTFRHVDFSACGPAITRMDTLTVHFWIGGSKTHGWRQLLEMRLNLKSLQYLGKNLADFQHPLPQNAVIFQLSDGIYTIFTSMSDYAPPPIAPPSKTASSSRVLPTASFDALLRLAKLDDSIQDALATRNKIAADLESLLEVNKDALTERDRVLEAADRLKTVDFAKKTVEKQLDKAKRQKSEKQDSLRNRRNLMSDDLTIRQKAAASMRESRANFVNMRGERQQLEKDIAGQRRRICEDLQKCYPIVPVPKKSLAFTIRGLHLPNSEDLETEPPDLVAAALGHISHALLLLSFYLNRPLPYPVTPRSSFSTIEDPISLLKTNSSTTHRYQDEISLRTYPLFSKGVPRFRFEYAVFLLNKDIQILLENCFNIRVLDIRQTLPNLKYLLYVATAGEGELPARKAGGVRGLLRAGGRPDLSSMHQGSSDSAASALSGMLWHGGTVDSNGKQKGAMESLKKTMGSLEKGKQKT